MMLEICCVSTVCGSFQCCCNACVCGWGGAGRMKKARRFIVVTLLFLQYDRRLRVLL